MNHADVIEDSRDRVQLLDVLPPMGGDPEIRTVTTAHVIDDAGGYVAEVRVDENDRPRVHVALTRAQCLALGALLLRAARQM